MPSVNFARLDYREISKQWDIIRDCFAGEHQIKFRREKYLPRPNSDDQSAENQQRYNAYLTRAVFYNVVKRTLNGLVGLLFTRDPVTYIPPELDAVVANADGSGADIIQLAKLACRLVVGYGRAGLFVDYPNREKLTTVADIQAGMIRPTIKVYEPWRVLNWRTVFREGLELLSMVVLQEPYVKSDDGFVVHFGIQYRVLRLAGAQEYVNSLDLNPETDIMEIPADVGIYKVELYRDTNLNVTHEEFWPKNGAGNPMNYIPFIFIGSENNRAVIDDPPLYDMAIVNVGHYRNSADYEESVYVVGQATPVFTGLTEAWVNGVLKNTARLGSRGAIPLPSGATAAMLQAQPNGMVFEALTHKEKQMVAIGANLIDTSKAPRTATETLIDDNNERSVLATAGDNVSEAFGFALAWCCDYQGVEVPQSPEITFCINTDFDLVRLTAQERQELILEWQSGAISWTEMRSSMKRGGVAIQDNNVALAEIKANPAPLPATPIAAKQPPGNAGGNDPTGG